jgi:hypothetical protein
MDAVWEGKMEKKASRQSRWAWPCGRVGRGRPDGATKRGMRRRKQRGLLKYVLQSRTRKDVMGEISGLLGAKLQIKRDTIFTEKTR